MTVKIDHHKSRKNKSEIVLEEGQRTQQKIENFGVALDAVGCCRTALFLMIIMAFLCGYMLTTAW